MSEVSQRARRVACAAFAAVAATVALVATTVASATTSYTNIPYAPADPPTSNGHLLDVFLPDGVGPGSRVPVLIWTAGSAWTADNGKGGAPSAAFKRRVTP
jgi:hypothetical protein